MGIRAWVTDSLERQFPLGKPGRARTIRLAAGRGERLAFQAAFTHTGATARRVSITARTTSGLRLRIRRVGCVPMPHHNTDTPRDERDGCGLIPGYVPDPLFDEQAILAAPREVNAFWITVDVPRGITPGAKPIQVELSDDDGAKASLTAVFDVSRVVVNKRKNFHVVHWFYADALCDRYGVEPFTPAFWRIAEKYMRNYADHGLDTSYVPIFTPPLDGIKRPTQLLKVTALGDGRYRFGWAQVKRWVDLARRRGIKAFCWTHLFTQWGCKHAIRIYEQRDGKDRLLWPAATGATSRTYRNFLSQFLPALKRFLQREKLLDVSYFHVSDEPHGDEHLARYGTARAMLRELAPWMTFMDALSDIRFGRMKLTDVPVPSVRTAKQFVDEGIPCWCYFCCGPRGRHVNRLLDTPPAKTRMCGWLFYRFGVGGFLHWGYNYWYESQTRRLIDPFTVTDGLRWPGWAYGDTFQVYPGPDGPIDSIRWELFAESLRDYALLQTLGVERDGRLLSKLKDFNDFPKDAQWIRRARRELLFPGGK